MGSSEKQTVVTEMVAFEKKKILLGIFLILAALFMVYFIVALWPIKSNGPNPEWITKANLLGWKFTIGMETRLIILVLLIGGLGSYVHASTSFATYVGNRSFASSWLWWYMSRPFIGMAIALILYFALRGGLVLLSVETNIKDLNPFGIAAIAGLSGMFSKQATDKLRDIFDNFFKTEEGKGDEQRIDKLMEMRPVEDVMVEKNQMTRYEIKPEMAEENVKITDLYDLLKGVVTRIPIINHDGTANCVIHHSMLYKFITEKLMRGEESPVDISTLSLKDFLDFPGMKELVKESLAFVPISAKLGEVKSEMEKNKICQDVFITKNGKSDEEVIGWLTNTDIAKNIKG
jgi:hypothetical protein